MTAHPPAFRIGAVQVFDAESLRELLSWSELIDGIAELLGDPDAQSPERHVHTVSRPGADEDLLLLMPAWITGKLMGVKAVTFFGSNTARGLSNINAAYLVFEGETGRPVAVMDGEELGSRRTMAASALASRSLAREDARRLLVVGTGQLAPNAVEAHAAVRELETIEVWGRDPDKAAAVVAAVEAVGIEASVAPDLDASVAAADIVSCVTSSPDPLIKGALLAAGAHLDLVGSFKSDMRESDDDCVRRASIFVDTIEGAMLAGDLAQPRAAGIIDDDDIEADLRALATGAHAGRSEPAEITMFKSAGFALEDLAAAQVALRTQSKS